MRVIFVTYYYSPYVSGLTLCLRGLAERLAAGGFDVHVVCGRHDPNSAREEVISGVRVHRLRSVGGVDKGIIVPALVPRALRLAGRQGIVVPVLPLVEAALLSWARRRNAVVPFYICDIRLGSSRPARIIERLAHLSARAAIRRSVAYAALSREYAKASRVIGDIPRPVVEVLPPIDPTQFAPVEGPTLRRRLGLADDARLIGFVGRLVQEKGIPILIDAVETLRRTRPDVRLVIAGEGNSVAGGGIGAALRERAGSEGHVVFAGFVPDADLPAFYSMLDVLALPSIDPLEAYGMVQVEAMLCGTPVVASDLPGVRIPIRRTSAGLLAAPGNAAELSVALGRVLDAPEEFPVNRALVVAELASDSGVSAFGRLLHALHRKSPRDELG